MINMLIRHKITKHNNKGFTLAELLIVIAIVAVIVAIAIPIFSSQVEKGRESTDLANIRSAYAEIASLCLEDETTTETRDCDLCQAQSGWQTASAETTLSSLGSVNGSPSAYGLCTVSWDNTNKKVVFSFDGGSGGGSEHSGGDSSGNLVPFPQDPYDNTKRKEFAEAFSKAAQSIIFDNPSETGIINTKGIKNEYPDDSGNTHTVYDIALKHSVVYALADEMEKLGYSEQVVQKIRTQSGTRIHAYYENNQLIGYSFDDQIVTSRTNDYYRLADASGHIVYAAKKAGQNGVGDGSDDGYLNSQNAVKMLLK